MTSVVDKENVVVKFYTNEEISCDKNNKRITITTYEPIYNFAIKKLYINMMMVMNSIC